MSAPVFGRLLTAMVTPMTFDGAVDLRRTGELAHKLVEEQNNDGIVVNGTTGESPTTDDVETIDTEGADDVVNTYPLVALDDAANPDAAAAFVAFVRSEEGLAVLAELGFGAP